MLKTHGTRLSQIKLSWMSWLGLSGAVSCCALVLVFGLMLFPTLPQKTNALDWTPDIEGKPVPDPSGTSVGINLPASIDFGSVTPTPDGATTTATADLTITTTDSAGYSLYLYSSDGDNRLKPKISSLANTSSINATAGGVGLTLSSLEPNTWGYNLGTSAPTDTTTYSAVPTDNSTPIQTKDTSDTNSANDTYTLSFGAKVDTSVSSGTYFNTLTVAVVAEPKSLTLSEITNMQEMTPKICAASAENETKRLTDTRDGKQYWVAKLKDGNCWMTQNLDYDLINGTQLTPDDSNLEGNWNPPSTTRTSIFYSTSNTGTYSYDPGMYVYSNPLATNSCNASTHLSECSDIGLIDVSDTGVWSPMSTIREDGVAIEGNNYDAHYLIGNYYQWNTATAQTGQDISSGNAAGSICPKGWKLPISGPSNNDSSGSFYNLLSQYGIDENVSGSGSDGQQYHINAAPLYFVDAGMIQNGDLTYIGSTSYLYSSSVPNSSYACNLGVHSTGEVWPSQCNGGRRFGYSVRCLSI